jgi:ABC-type sugar transport system substrate-binding protein
MMHPDGYDTNSLWFLITWDKTGGIVMTAICRLTCVLALLVAGCINVGAEDKMTDTSGRKIWLGALYKNDVADSYIKGIESAVDKTGMTTYVDIQYFLYYNEQQGLEILIDLITKKKVDIVLGPTDSGIFSRALERREELEAYKIPVISPLVTATADNQPEGWFFRTNVDVGRRVEAIHDYLNKCLIRSVAILYADTEFGRRAEESFRTELRGSQEDKYEPLPFESLGEAREGLRQVLDSRPEALGIFGSNEDIVRICNYLQCMNPRGISYRPFLFTIMDARLTADEVDDLYFVSVAKCDVTGTTKDPGRAETPDEVETLTYDTCILLLSEFKRMPPGPFAPKQFRDQFAALLRGPVKEPGPKTGMAFHKYRNSVPPKVFHIHRGEVEQVNLSQVIRWPQKLSIKWELIKRRYGFWPMVNIGLLILIVASVSILDLKRWYGKGLIKEALRPHLYLLIVVNFLLVFILYFFLAETGSIEYDSVVMALIIAFAPSALLRTTFFETHTGKAIGLAKLYD